MNKGQGFSNLVTDGTYLYASNAYEGVVSRFTASGAVEERFLVFNEGSPLFVAIMENELYVYVVKGASERYGSIHVYDISTNALLDTIPLATYSLSPILMVYERNLYVSSDTGQIVKITPDRFQFSYTIGIPGITGMSFVLGSLYVSSEIQNAIYLVSLETSDVEEKFAIDSPRGLASNGDSLYVCFGKQIKNSGLATYSATLSVRTSLINYFLFSQFPLNVLYAGELYLTMTTSNTIFRGEEAFSNAPFRVSVSYNADSITKSVIATDPACLNNDAYKGLIQLRTVGSNQHNPIQPITDLYGRGSGNNIQFNMGLGTSYDSLQMRRKAETLRYRKNANDPGVVLTKKNQFTQTLKSGGAYNFSRAQLARLLEENGGVPCSIGFNNGQPIDITPPWRAGISDPHFEGYYMNPYVTYYPSL